MNHRIVHNFVEFLGILYDYMNDIAIFDYIIMNIILSQITFEPFGLCVFWV